MWPFRKAEHNGRALVAEGALLLDVRTPDEYRQGHVSGAVNVPLQELPARLNELTPETRKVVVYCRSGGRSAAAAQLLQRSGRDVLDIGGMANW